MARDHRIDARAAAIERAAELDHRMSERRDQPDAGDDDRAGMGAPFARGALLHEVEQS